MEIGVGLPNTVPGATGPEVMEWARRADAGPFASVGVLDRVAYRSLDPFPSLAAAATVTSRIRLATMIVVGPIRSTALLAKQAASVDQVSGGRLVLGLGLGARREDYEASGADFAGRAARRCWWGAWPGPRCGGWPGSPTATRTAAGPRGRSLEPRRRPWRHGPTPSGPGSRSCGGRATSGWAATTWWRPAPRTSATTTRSPARSRRRWPPGT